MNYQHLTYFLEIAKIQNFTLASENLFVTQSALSKAIHQLEQELGVPLFEKKGRNVSLSYYGKVFCQHVSIGFTQINDGIQIVRDMADVNKGQITISAIYTICSYYLPTKLLKFKTNESFDQVKFNIDYKITSLILKDILDGTADIGFCGDYDRESDRYKDLESSVVVREELIVILPKNHPLSKHSIVDFDLFKNEKFITYKAINSGLYYIFEKLCKHAGFKPNIAFEVADDHTLIGLVESGHGIALTADSKGLNLQNVEILRFKENIPHRTLYMVWKKDRYTSSIARKFLNFILSNNIG